MAQALKTDFDDEIETQETPVTTAVDKDEDGVPYCVKHHCRMKQYSGSKKGSSVAHYSCPVDGCTEKSKRIKTSKPIIPAEPHVCPRCSSIKPRPIMERNARLSNAMYTLLQCPCCGHKSAPMPRPEFVHNHAQARSAITEPELGAR